MVSGQYAIPLWNQLPFPTLTTERLSLREVVPEDADDIFAFRSDAEVQRYNLIPMRDRREALSLVTTMQGWYASRYAIQWGITLLGENRVLGLCGLHDWSRQHRRASIGYDLLRSHWGQGIALEAMREVVRFGFEEMDLVRLEALTIAENARSIRLLDRLGFTLEGVKQGNSWQYDTRFRGSVVYGLAHSDYDRRAAVSGQAQG
jgi:ribosomal-protein-alanine N-acetyltransferase